MVLTSDDKLQNRYCILRRLGGGGMGVVYLAEDSRLPGRYCAIKEMSPEQLAPQDRNWAIQAFKQEAQMLGTLGHPGLAAVTDFFPEEGNWYLVMEFVEGESLEQRLKGMPGGRMTSQEALGIMRQLCDVLEYLHSRTPPVIFRDLKPSNVMLTPGGQVKLIDFGIARFFKAGQTRDTMNMGTPGYAAPEQYGGMGQSDPRTDIYSLGVVLYRMVTGFDPTEAVTPFTLPSIESLVSGISPEVSAVVSRARQMAPELRFSSVVEMRRALFSPPTAVLPPERPRTGTRRVEPAAPVRQAPAEAGKGSGKGIGMVIAGFGGLALCVGLVIAAIVLLRGGFPWPTQTPDAATPPSITEETTGETPTGMPGMTKAPTATPEPGVPSRPTEPPTATLPPSAAFNWSSLGRSVQGRDLSVASVGYEGGTAVVVIGGIQGDQPLTRDLVNALIGYFQQNPNQVPDNTGFYFIPTINPDGNAANSRYNANDVDLNRNWDARDWKANAAVPGYPDGKPGAGGSRPFSEPETRALRDFLVDLSARSPRLQVMLLHSSVRRTQGEIYPGGDSSLGISLTYAAATAYDIQYSWAEYVTSGEAVTWCDEQGMLSIDIVVPASQSPTSRVSGNRTLLEITVQALKDIAVYR